MKTERKKQVQAINQILRQQQRSMSRLKLFDQGFLDQLPLAKANQSQNISNLFYGKETKESNLQSNAVLQPRTNLQQFAQQTSEQQHADQDEIYKMNLSPVSRLSLEKKRQIIKKPPVRKKIFLSHNQLSKKFIKQQASVKISRTKFAPSLKRKASLYDIPYQKAKKHIWSHPQLFKVEKTPKQVYNTLRPLFDKFRVQIVVPLIKQYRNCTYFGTTYEQNSHHQGFLIFQTQKKIYYGQMLADKKNGKGIEIDLARNIVYKGHFEKGRKKGSFQVIRPTEKYIGQLINDQYAGFGKLFTDVSIYNGYFQEGLRHGQGQQTFPQTGLKITGTFLRNQFTNNQQKLQNSRFKNASSALKNQKLKKSIVQMRVNPELSFRNSRVQDKKYYFKDYNYGLRARQVSASNQMDRQNNGEKKAGYIYKRKRSIQQEQPLANITQWADKR